jgi:hypothetical protein
MSEKKGFFCRRRDVMDLLGVTDKEITKLVEAGVLTVRKLRKGAKALFVRSEVVALMK